jgi:hypothetical protein
MRRILIILVLLQLLASAATAARGQRSRKVKSKKQSKQGDEQSGENSHDDDNYDDDRYDDDRYDDDSYRHPSVVFITAPSPTSDALHDEKLVLPWKRTPYPSASPSLLPSSMPSISPAPTATKKRKPIKNIVNGIVDLTRRGPPAAAPPLSPISQPPTDKKRKPIQGIVDIVRREPRTEVPSTSLSKMPLVSPSAAPSGPPTDMPSISPPPSADPTPWPTMVPTPDPTRKKLINLKPIRGIIADLNATPMRNGSTTTSYSPTTSPKATLASFPVATPSWKPSSVTTASAYDDDLTYPEGNWDPYTLPQLEKGTDFFSYSVDSYGIRESQGDRTFGVTDTCVYTISGSDIEKTQFERPEQWLEQAVQQFGGRMIDNGASFTGVATPSESDISVDRSGFAFKVLISGSSPAISGGVSMEWDSIPMKKRAEDFAELLQTARLVAPKVFLTNQSNRCGSGPFCMNAGTDACYLDPTTGILEVRKKREAGAVHCFTDSLEWFGECAASFGCKEMEGGGKFLYKPSPNTRVVGTRFSFDEDGVEGNPIQWECGYVQAANELSKFAVAAARDPLSPFAIGGPVERPVLHL